MRREAHSIGNNFMSNIEQLREKAKALGIDVDGRWSEARIQAEIESVGGADNKGGTDGGSKGDESKDDFPDYELKVLEQDETIQKLNDLVLELQEANQNLGISLNSANQSIAEKDMLIAKLEQGVTDAKALIGRTGDIADDDFSKPFLLKNMTRNRISSLGLDGAGSVVIGADKLGDEKLIKRIKHGIAIGTLDRG
jgi:hypothetical protein